MQVEGAAGFSKAALRAAEHQRAEFEACMHVGEEHLAVLEIKQCPEAAGGADTAEEFRRALVGGNAAWGQQCDKPVRRNQRLCAFDEQAVEVDIAPPSSG